MTEQRFSPRVLSTTDAVAGDVLTYDPASDAYGPAAPGGGASAVGRDRRWNILTGETSVDEFDNDSLAAAWARVDGTGAVLANCEWGEGADALSCLNLGGDTTAAIHGLVRPLSGVGGPLAVGDGFITCLSWVGPSANHSIMGLVFSDGNTHGAGNQLFASVNGSDASVLLRRHTNWTTLAASTGPGNYWAAKGLIYIRLSLIAANTWRQDISIAGNKWITSPTLAFAMTPTHVGFGSSSWSGSHKHTAAYEFIRRVSGVT